MPPVDFFMGMLAVCIVLQAGDWINASIERQLRINAARRRSYGVTL